MTFVPTLSGGKFATQADTAVVYVNFDPALLQILTMIA